MVEPDPWCVVENNFNKKTNPVSSTLTSETNTIVSTFEDNFSQIQSNSTRSLPDSSEYIETLERKLSKLKKSSNYLDQLKARREHCIENLLVGNINLEDCTNENNQHLEEEFETNRRRDILRYIQPEQPNNLGESVALINHDQLEQQHDQETSTEEDISNLLQ